MNIFVYTFSIIIIASYLMSGIFILLLRGFKPPMTYMLLNRFLGVLFGIFIMLQVSHTPLYGKVLWNPSHVLMSLTLYPLLFLYVFDMLRPGSVGRRLLLTVFLPSATLTALYFIFEACYGRLPLFADYAELGNFLRMPQLWVTFAGASLSFALTGFLSVRAFRMLRLHKRNLESNFSYTEGCTLGWMSWAIGITLLQWCVVMTGIMVEGGIGQKIGLILFTVEPTIVTALILRQKDLYSKNNSDKKAGIEPDGHVVELSSEKRKILKDKLLTMLDKDRIYQNPNLTIETLCAILNTNHTYLWQVINKDMNTTFYRLINDRRIDFSVEMMRDPRSQSMPLKSIADICGFKSVNAFIVQFKRKFDKTPNEWRKEIPE